MIQAWVSLPGDGSRQSRRIQWADTGKGGNLHGSRTGSSSSTSISNSSSSGGGGKSSASRYTQQVVGILKTEKVKEKYERETIQTSRSFSDDIDAELLYLSKDKTPYSFPGDISNLTFKSVPLKLNIEEGTGKTSISNSHCLPPLR